MATAQELINSAAKFAGLLAEGQTLEGGVNADALNRLNRMLSRWKNNGVDLGVPTLSASDTVYVDNADEEAIEVNLALRLMVRFKLPVSPGVSEAGSEAYTELQAKYGKIDEMALDLALTDKRTYNVNTE
jgi:hypothetical protein|tara:strand:+ start:308 stop:697 length:390 start_codon:yes stop_codon:yes gene_type:complete